MSDKTNEVAILSGSASDAEFVEATKVYLDHFGVSCEDHVMSAHRNPEKVSEFVHKFESEGGKIIIAQAGMAAHLAGVVASHTTLPVIGVPLPGSALEGTDALYSTVQMPAGIPVATVAIGKAGSRNAAVLAVEILALNDEDYRRKLKLFREKGSKV